jgi:hypothetical protein
MRRLISRRPSPAMAVAFVALLAALTGTAVALPGTNTVNSGDIVNNTIRSKDVRNNNLRGKDIRNGSLAGRDVKNGSLTGADVKDDSLTGADINEGTLGTVPSATNAQNAQSATNATQLGGLPPSGYQTRVRWALVAANGTILRQSGGISLTAHPADGNYYLNFGSPVVGKLIHVTGSSLTDGTGNQGGSPCGGAAAGPDAIACVPPAANNANHVFVFTYQELAGDEALNDRSFYVSVSD